MRTETRRERYKNKKQLSVSFPVEVACINFMHEPNIGYVVRAAACFGASKVNLIGSAPEPKYLREISGTTSDYIDISTYSKPHDFLEYIRQNNIHLVSAEITPDAKSIHDYTFPKNKKVCIVVGNEQSGITADILKHSEVVEIPMPGVGYCLNTAATAHILLYEYNKQVFA
jgi:tRNA (guanosine-2'-O-)-methyltransferase